MRQKNRNFNRIEETILKFFYCCCKIIYLLRNNEIKTVKYLRVEGLKFEVWGLGFGVYQKQEST